MSTNLLRIPACILGTRTCTFDNWLIQTMESGMILQRHAIENG